MKKIGILVACKIFDRYMYMFINLTDKLLIWHMIDMLTLSQQTV